MSYESRQITTSRNYQKIMPAFVKAYYSVLYEALAITNRSLPQMGSEEPRRSEKPRRRRNDFIAGQKIYNRVDQLLKERDQRMANQIDGLKRSDYEEAWLQDLSPEDRRLLRIRGYVMHTLSDQIFSRRSGNEFWDGRQPEEEEKSYEIRRTAAIVGKLVMDENFDASKLVVNTITVEPGEAQTRPRVLLKHGADSPVSIPDDPTSISPERRVVEGALGYLRTWTEFLNGDALLPGKIAAFATLELNKDVGQEGA